MLFKAFKELMHTIGTWINEPEGGSAGDNWIYNKQLREYEYVGPPLPKKPNYVSEPDPNYEGKYYICVLREENNFIMVVSREAIEDAVEVIEEEDIDSLNYMIRIVKAGYEAIGNVQVEGRL